MKNTIELIATINQESGLLWAWLIGACLMFVEGLRALRVI